MFQKFAAADVLEARIQRGGMPSVIGHKHSFSYQARPGFLYVRSRAISSRTNDNYDNFPAEEIKAGYRSFVGKPVFVNHRNEDHRRARGVIIDAALHEDRNPDGSADTWVEVLMEVDAVRFPKLAQAILAGEIDRTSMGVDVAFSICSVCNNKASTPLEYCKHIPAMKGLKVQRTTASGEKENVLVYEKCYGLSFFENSLLVEEPADPTAFFLGVDDRGVQSLHATLSGSGGVNSSFTFSGGGGGIGGRGSAEVLGTSTGEMGKVTQLAPSRLSPATASRKQGYGEMKAPVEVDTLREEFCPVCGETDSFDGETCKVCQYIKPPDEFLDPDLEKAQQVDLHQQADEMEDKAEQMDEMAEEGEVQTDEMPGEEEQLEGEDESPFGTDEESPEGEDSDADQPESVDEEDSGEDEDEEEDPDGENGKDQPPWMKKKKKDKKESRLFRAVTGGGPSMGPVLTMLTSQQKTITALRKENAGLKAGLQALASLAGVEAHVAAVVKKAEDENPAQPEGWALPSDSPAPEAPAFTTEETLGEIDNESVEGGGLPDDPTDMGETTESDVAPDATTSVESTDTVLDEPLDLNEQNVDAPVAGTDTLGEGERGEAGTNRTETEVRIGDPNKSDVAYPESGWTEASKSPEERFIASLRLARLRIAARIETGDDLALATSIVQGSQSDDEISAEISTLEKVVSVRSQQRPQRPMTQPRGNVAPRVAQRTAPSLVQVPEIPQVRLASSPSDDEFLFDFGPSED